MSCKKDIIKRLARVKNDDDFKSVIRKCKCEDIQRIVELVVLAMSKQVPVSKRQAKILRENRKCLRHLVHPQYSLKSKKRFLIQHGGGKAGLAKAGARLVGKALGGLARSPVMTRALTKQLATASSKIPLTSMKGMSKSTSSLASAGSKATTS